MENIEQILKQGPPKHVARFVEKITIGEKGCWLWNGMLTTNGYGRFKFQNKSWRAHRLAYLWATGSVPSVLDHIVCDTPRCCNPSHVKPSSQRDNVLRGSGPTARHAAKTHCDRGHEYTKENTSLASGQRRCLACKRLEYQRKKQLSTVERSRTLKGKRGNLSTEE